MERGWRASRAGAALVAVVLSVTAGWAGGRVSTQPVGQQVHRLLAAETAPAPTIAPAKQPVVAAIDVQPARYEGLVLDAMRCKVGEPFDDAKLQADVNTILDLGWFRFTTAGEAGGSRVTKVPNAAGEMVINVNLVENPIVSGIEFHGVADTEKPSAEQLANEIGYLRVGWPLNTNRDKMDRALLALTTLYRGQLKIDAKVDLLPATVAPGPYETKDGKLIVHLQVTKTGEVAPGGTTPTPATPGGGTPTPGTPGGTAPTPGGGVTTPALPDLRMRISKIEVQGLKTVSESLVRDTITVREGQIFDRAVVQADINRLNALGYFYFQSDRESLSAIGYPLPPASERGSRVEPVPEPDGQGLTLVFHLVEHPTIRAVELRGNTLFTRDKLIGRLNHLVVGRAFKALADVIDRESSRMTDLYGEQGYRAFVNLGADGKPLLSPVDGGVKVSFTIVEARVGTISFKYTGRKRTNPKVFSAYMKTKPGAYYNLNRIQEDTREIMRLDVLESFALSRESGIDPKDPSRLNLIFDVTEKRTINLSAGGGISSRYGLVGFVDASESNLFGLAHRVSARVEAGGRFNADLNYFWPLLDGRGTEFTTRLYNTDDKTGATGLGAFTNRRQNFDQTRRGASLLFSRPLGTGIRASVGYKIENVSTARRGTLLPSLPPFPFQDVGSDTTSSVTLGITRDVRDYPLDATRGSYASASLEYAGLGGDNNFQKYRLEGRTYFPVLGGKVASGRREPRPAWVVAGRGQVSYSTGRLPFSQSFFVGGADSLRGYSEDRFFGNRAFLMNLELRRALPNNIQVVLFFDAGRAWRQGEPLDFFSNLATSLGLGARVATPLGPIRLDYGWGGEGSKLHFSFGQAF
ncbi:MAG: BamA/TamA family outer membrane protein [Armatimonadetes bacterium]|nr:BamA/TamA family outer membrane protein [Armatimonadota bacterium]